jgi:hypothetical protein
MCMFSVLCMCVLCMCVVCHVCVLCVVFVCVCMLCVLCVCCMCVLCVFSVCCVCVCCVCVGGPRGDEGTVAALGSCTQHWDAMLSCPVQAQPVDLPVLSSPVSWTAPAGGSCPPLPLPPHPLPPPFITLLPLPPFLFSHPLLLPFQHSILPLHTP